jgi:hypothetical protein
LSQSKIIEQNELIIKTIRDKEVTPISLKDEDGNYKSIFDE